MKFANSVRKHTRDCAHSIQLLAAFALLSAISVLGACSSSSSGNDNPPPATLAITTPSLPGGQTGTAYSVTLTATGGTPPFTWTQISGTLPMGLTLNASTGAIAGTPTQSVTGASLTFQVADSGNPQQIKVATLSLSITTPGNLSLSISPKRGGLTVLQTLPVSATVVNDSMNKGVSWSASGGSFSAMTSASGASVAYTAPSSAGIYTITATSASDMTQTASATIGVTDLHGVYTFHNDLSRDGSNIAEYALTTANVNSSTFGKLFSCSADGAIYAQPLWVANVNIGGAKHNVVVAATMRDSVYVFDADANPCLTYWHKQFIPAGETFGNNADLNTSDIFPDIGILGTPVIDSAANTIYAVTKTKTNVGGAYHQRLHALSLIDGSERAQSPVEIDSSITVPGNCEGGSNVAFNAQTENQRPGLALVNGVVYLSWASHGDNDPYHGWIIGYSTSNLTRVALYNSSPNAAEGLGYCRAGIWMSGGAPAADANNNLYVITGNGIFDGTSAFGDSVLKLGTSVGLTVSDWFTPSDQLTLDGNDTDLGSGGAAILVDQPSGPHPQLLIGGGKSGILYLIDRTSMGHIATTGPDQVVQALSVSGGSFSTPAFWNNTLFYFGSGTAGKSYSFLTASNTFNISSVASTPTSFGFPGCSPSVSSNGTSNGIVWVIDGSSYGTHNSGSRAAGPAILHAYDAKNLGTELWNSSQSAGDTAGNAVKFTVPTVANGKVYVPTRGNDSTQGTGSIFGEIDVYGLKPN